MSHDNITGVCRIGMEYMGFHHGEEVLLSYLPSCHVASLVVDAFMMMHIGAAVYCADKNALKGTLVNAVTDIIM